MSRRWSRTGCPARRGFPTVSAGVILSPAADGVPALLESVRHPEKDVFTAARAELKEHLLGPSDPPSLARFNAAIAELCTKADERRIRMESRLAAEIPGPREAADELEPESEGESNDAEDSVNA